MKRPSAIGVFPVVVLVAAALIGGYEFGGKRGEDRAENRLRAITFLGAVISIDTDGTGGCVRPDRGYDVPDSDPDGACGPMFWTTQAAPRVGQRVRVTLIRGRDQRDADVGALLVSAP